MDYLNLTVELVTGFILLFIIVKILGRKIINQITPFTFIAAIVLGELLGNALYNNKIKPLHIVYAMVLWAAMLFIVEILGQKFLKLRLIFEGKPAVLIHNGVINREQMKKNRMNLNQLQSLIRQAGTFSVREVAYCYLESNGSLSILKKSEYQQTTQTDFQLPQKEIYVPVTLIRDGELMKDELRDLGKSEAWLKKQLETHQVKNWRDVFIAEWLEGDGLFVQSFSE